MLSPVVLVLGAALCQLGPAAAASQAMVASIPPSPTGQDCTLYSDHWDCTKPCVTRTTTVWGLAATTVTDYSSWRSSMDKAHSVPGATSSGRSIPVYTTVGTFGGGAVVTGTVYYDSAALSKAGYSLTNTVTAVVSCPPTTTPTLPPSPTGSICSPHYDHWHCQPSAGAATATGTCTPHEDHWHCPPGVAEPTVAPGAATGGDTESSASVSAASDLYAAAWSFLATFVVAVILKAAGLL